MKTPPLGPSGSSTWRWRTSGPFGFGIRQGRRIGTRTRRKRSPHVKASSVHHAAVCDTRFIPASMRRRHGLPRPDTSLTFALLRPQNRASPAVKSHRLCQRHSSDQARICGMERMKTAVFGCGRDQRHVHSQYAEVQRLGRGVLLRHDTGTRPSQGTTVRSGGADGGRHPLRYIYRADRESDSTQGPLRPHQAGTLVGEARLHGKGTDERP